MAESPVEWAGYFQAGDRVEFFKVNGTVGASPRPTLDLPNRQVFGLEVTIDAASPGDVACHTDIGGERLAFSGTLTEDTFTGNVSTGDLSGSFELRRVAVWDASVYRALSAAYQAGAGRHLSVFVNLDEWLGSPILFYQERDRCVRLYPASDGTLISEALERIGLSSDNHDLRWLRSVTSRTEDNWAAVTRLSSWEEEHLRISGPDGTLAGTLMKPAGDGPHAAIVLIHGAAGGLRDGYRAFAEHYLEAGMAALVFDRRGHGESTGDPRPSFEEKSLDAEAWVDYLQSRQDIKRDRIGVWGFSNGSWVAPLVAARRPDVAFVATIGASGTTAIETEIHRRTFDLREQGVPEDQLEEIAELWRLAYDLLLSRRPDPAAAQRFDQLTTRLRDSEELAAVALQHYAVLNPFLGPIPPYESYQALVDDLPNHAPDSDEWTCDPADSYRVIRSPVLFLAGDHDSNLPALSSVQRVSKVLHDAGNHEATVILFPNTGHQMNFVDLGSDVGMTSEEAGYRLHHFRFAGGFVDIIKSWAAPLAAS